MTHTPNTLLKTETGREWWRGATIYQVYPRSFCDSNGDGIGDLAGITSKLDYIASLGVNALWISPFFTSPMKDFGYDVADYCDVDPIFGALADFDALLEKAHGLGLKVIIDQVYSHTSDQHDWFAESRSTRDNERADWYVWADAKADGSPPSNWQSVFGGPAWTWDARRGQYYLHNFLKEQPQINGHNPKVQEALLATAKFWLDRGVDGFRVDAINFMMHDPKLTDNPPAPASNKVRTRPFDFQLRLHNQSHPDIPMFIEKLRALADSYPDRFTFAEVGGDDSDREIKLYTQGDARFNSAYGFNYLYADAMTPGLVREAVEAWPEEMGTGWPSWAFSNHDAARWISRWAPPQHQAAYASMVMLLFVALRGNIIFWQGEELGLTQVDIPFDQLKDPEAIANWPLTLNRDGSRTPMPWIKDAPYGGFSNTETWLPLGDDHSERAVDVHNADPASLLNLTRRLIALRNANDALLVGGLKIAEANDKLLVLERVSENQHLVCAYNFGSGAINWAPAQPDRWRLLETVNAAEAWMLPAFGGLIAERIA
jgi:alpha-glucosidase